MIQIRDLLIYISFLGRCFRYLVRLDPERSVRVIFFILHRKGL